MCSTCYDGAFDLQNHPQNKPINVRDNEALKDALPEVSFAYVTVSAVPLGLGQYLNLDTGEVTLAP